MDDRAVTKLSFEEAFKELESIVGSLENVDTITLDGTITLYERGIALKQHCETILNGARLKVEKIIKDSQGHVSAAPADDLVRTE